MFDKVTQLNLENKVLKGSIIEEAGKKRDNRLASMNSDNREAEVIDLDSVENMKIDVDGGSEEEE